MRRPAPTHVTPDPSSPTELQSGEGGSSVAGDSTSLTEASTGALARPDTGGVSDAPGPTDEAGGEPPAADGDLDDGPAAPGLTWAKVAILGAALAFLGFAVGLFVSRDQPPAADSVDVGFVQDMLTHHEQALGVATLTVAYGEDPTVRSYAREVLTAQAYEQGIMSRMLAEWGYSRADRPDTAMGWMDMPMPLEQMPGLLSDDQLNEINEARGSELDALFLEGMAEHHRGGIHMAEYAAAEADDPDLRELADRMARAQASEINEYRYTADQLGFDVDIPAAEVPPGNLPETEG